MIIDSHSHIGRLMQDTRFDKSFENNFELLKNEMKEAGVDHSFLLATFRKDFIGEPDTQTLMDIVGSTKGFSVAGSVDVLNNLQKDLQAAEKWLKEKAIIAVKLYPGYQEFQPNEDRCRPIYEMCVKYDVPVIFHSGDTLNNYDVRGKVRFSHPLHIDDVAVDFPKLKIVIAHLGNPWLDDCAELLYKNDNCFADISGIVVGERLDTPYGKLIKRKIEELAIYSSPDKLLFGTDWPLASLKDYVEFTQSLDFKSASMDRIFYKNAIDLFNLNI